MKKSGLKILVILSHSVVIISLMLPLLMLSGSFDGGSRAKNNASEAPPTALGTQMKPIAF